MKTFFVVLGLAALAGGGCASSETGYRPTTTPERIEFSRDSLDVYPEDVRRDPDQYKRTGVAWAGVILHSETEDCGDGMVRIRTEFEHHYYDWEEMHGSKRPKFGLSPRGEGKFRTEWLVRKVDPDSDMTAAQKYAAPGKLVIVYGVPHDVDSDGVVTLKYRYIRVVDREKYTMDDFDYGRFGEPVVYLK